MLKRVEHESARSWDENVFWMVALLEYKEF